MAKPPSHPTAHSLPLLVIVAGEKGGVGKTLTSLALVDIFRLHDAPLQVLQIDQQARLSRALGGEVTTIRVDGKLARRDPASAARAYTPIYDAVEQIGSAAPSVLVDVGANEGTGFSQWLGLVDLAADVEEWGTRVLVVAPFVAESEAIRQAGNTTRMLLEQLPTADLLLLENERDGRIVELHPACDASKAYVRQIAPLKRRARGLSMPMIEAGSWRPFEAAGCRPLDVVAMSVAQVMEVTGLPRAEAKIVRGDVAAWFAVLVEAFCGVIAFPEQVTK